LWLASKDQSWIATSAATTTRQVSGVASTPIAARVDRTAGLAVSVTVWLPSPRASNELFAENVDDNPRWPVITFVVRSNPGVGEHETRRHAGSGIILMVERRVAA
jgi:hypothetical protein